MANDDARLEELESKVAFQEDTIQKLNDVLIEHDTRVHDLESSFRLLLESLSDQATGLETESEDEPPPPHY